MRLGHDDTHDLAVPHQKIDGKQPDVAFLHDTSHGFRSGNQAQLREYMHGAHDWVTREGNFLGRCENAKADDSSRVCRWKHEDALGEIHLAGDLLKLSVGETLGFGKHRNRFPPKG